MAMQLISIIQSKHLLSEYILAYLLWIYFQWYNFLKKNKRPWYACSEGGISNSIGRLYIMAQYDICAWFLAIGVRHKTHPEAKYD